jgi:hypothetical protein
VAFSLQACAFGNSFRYNDLHAAMPAKKGHSIAAATLDHRPYVLDEDSDPSYAGMTRGGYGNPFSAYTTSGQPLADELTGILVRSLQRAGVQAVAVPTQFRETGTDVIRSLAATETDRGILLTLRNWQSDTMVNTTLEYDVELQVLDATGAVLASKNFKGADDLGGNAFNPYGYAMDKVPPAVSKLISTFFAAPEVRKALE